MSENKVTAKEAWKKEYMQKGAATIVWGGAIGTLMLFTAAIIAALTFSTNPNSDKVIAFFFTAAILCMAMMLFLLSFILNLLRDIKKEFIDWKKE